MIKRNEDGQIVANCDNCQAEASVNQMTGALPTTWLSGQLWIDVSLSQQRQFPLCWCPDCKLSILGGGEIKVEARL